MAKLKKVKSINKVYDLLDKVSISLDTNLTREQILDFYNVFKKVILSSDSLSDSNDVISMQKTYLTGSSAMIYDKRSGLVLYNYVPSTSSLKAIVKAMKINLELMDEEYDTSFSFSIDKPYEPTVIGENESGGATVTLLPDFTGSSKSYVSSWCSSRGISVNFEYKDVTSGYTQDQVISQSASASTSIADISSLTVTVANVKTTSSDNSSNSTTNNTESTYKNKCVSEGSYYYWYDANGDKNPTKYIDSTCKNTNNSSSDNNSSSSNSNTDSGSNTNGSGESSNNNSESNSSNEGGN